MQVGMIVVAGVLSIFCLFIFTIFIWVPMCGCAPLGVKECSARLIRGLHCKKGLPGSKPFTFHEVSPKVLLGSLPHTREHLRSLVSDNDVSGMVTMNQSWELPGNGITVNVKEIREEGIECLWLPTPDYNPVKLEDMDKGADFVHDTVQKNKSVYVHCNGGRGRSTIIVLAYLIKYKGMDPLGAFLQCKRQRKIAHLTMCCGIRPQWRCVKNFERHIRKQTKVSPKKAARVGVDTPTQNADQELTSVMIDANKVQPIYSDNRAGDTPTPPDRTATGTRDAWA